MKYQFTKLEGAGNDYLYFDGFRQEIPENPEFIKKISDRHFGVGSDGVIIALPSKKADFKMRMYNADGSRGKMCGNGIRCLAKFCYDKGLTKKKVLAIETDSGLRTVRLITENGKVKRALVNMQAPIFKTTDIPCTLPVDQVKAYPLTISGKEYLITSLSMGNPHVVTFVDDVAGLDLSELGQKFSEHPVFPEQVNAGFCQVVNDQYLKLRVYERGSGETLACGTGACAAMVAAYINGYIKNKAIVEVKGGKLMIEYRDGLVYMEGPANTVFEGQYEEEENG